MYHVVVSALEKLSPLKIEQYHATAEIMSDLSTPWPLLKHTGFAAMPWRLTVGDGRATTAARKKRRYMRGVLYGAIVYAAPSGQVVVILGGGRVQ